MRTWHWCAIVFAFVVLAIGLTVLITVILLPALWIE